MVSTDELEVIWDSINDDLEEQWDEEQFISEYTLNVLREQSMNSDYTWGVSSYTFVVMTGGPFAEVTNDGWLTVTWGTNEYKARVSSVARHTLGRITVFLDEVA